MNVGDLARLSDPTPEYETWRNRVGVIRRLEADYADFQPTGETFALRVAAHRVTPIDASGAAENNLGT